MVVGGSTAAVAAAVAAAKHGGRVFLAAPRHYLGDDMAGTLRLWLEPGERARSALALSLFSDPDQENAGLPFSYKADRPSTGVHRDSSPPSLLCDGRWTDAAHGSVQYDDDVTIRVDLHQSQPVKALRAMLFAAGDYAVESVSVAMSEDALKWREAGRAKSAPSARGSITLTVPLTGSARYLRCTFKKAPKAHRMLLGEIVVDPAVPLMRPRRSARQRRCGSNGPSIGR